MPQCIFRIFSNCVLLSQYEFRIEGVFERRKNRTSRYAPLVVMRTSSYPLTANKIGEKQFYSIDFFCNSIFHRRIRCYQCLLSAFIPLSNGYFLRIQNRIEARNICIWIWTIMIFSLLFLSRNSGNSFGGNLNLTRMGGYSIGDKRLSITFTETTIVRRMNVDGIRVRTMVVVRSAVRRAREKKKECRKQTLVRTWFSSSRCPLNVLLEHIRPQSPSPSIRWDRIFSISTLLLFQATNKFNESFDRYLDHTNDPHLDSMNRFNYRLLTYVRDLFNFR